MLFKIFNATNHQKILNFLVSNQGREYYDREISRITDVSRAGTNFALRDLVKAGLAKRDKRGRMYFYSIDGQDIIIRYFKILQNLIVLYPLINELKPLCLKLILYGSYSIGENLEESDLDIFIVSFEKVKIKKIFSKSPLKEKSRPIIVTPNELVKFKKENPVFYEEISKGITLCQQKQT